MKRTHGEMPRQAPFAVVVGCSDARVPTEMLFGQGFNDLFVIRVAGNVLGDVCMGSVDFALNALGESVRVVVVLGHSGCGGLERPVDAYLKPTDFWSESTSPMLRSITRRIFVAVREAANGLTEVWGDGARDARLPRGGTDRVGRRSINSSPDRLRPPSRGRRATLAPGNRGPLRRPTTSAITQVCIARGPVRPPLRQERSSGARAGRPTRKSFIRWRSGWPRSSALNAGTPTIPPQAVDFRSIETGVPPGGGLDRV